MKYAAIRNILLRKGIEITANYEPSLHYFGEWWKQLFQGKARKRPEGIFPQTVNLTTDLHQWDSSFRICLRIMFETV